MKLTLNFSLFLFTLFFFVDNAFSLSNYQIKKICKKEKKELAFIKILQKKRFDLQKGNPIEIPVKPYKR